jgi:hypothetical protein
MSSRSALLVAALLAAVRPVPAVGQGVALRREVRRLEGSVDSLARRSADASALAAAAEVPRSLDRADEGFRPIRVGGFQLLTNESPLPVAEGATLAWEILTRYYGRYASGADLPVLVIMGIDPDSVGRSEPGRADIIVPWDLPAADLAWSIIRSRVPPSGDAALNEWAGGAPVPTGDRTRGLARAFGELMFSPYSQGHDCMVVDLSACVGALRLAAADSQVAAAFPTPGDRRAAAASIAQNNRNAALRAPLDRCLGSGEDAGCEEVLRSLPPGSAPAVGGRESRRSLLDAALAAGGPEGFERLLASAGRPMGERLAAAAGMPLSDLLGQWRAEMRRARPTASPWSWGSGVAGLAWTLCFAVVALLGSRWRAD